MPKDDKKPATSELKSADTSIIGEDEHRRASVAKITKVSSILTVLVSGLALFSDGMAKDLPERCPEVVD